jgi:hypothetical protein
MVLAGGLAPPEDVGAGWPDSAIGATGVADRVGKRPPPRAGCGAASCVAFLCSYARANMAAASSLVGCCSWTSVRRGSLRPAMYSWIYWCSVNDSPR